MTNAYGYHRIEPVLTGDEFTWQAEKPGYAPSSGRFIVIHPNERLSVGLSDLNFEMARTAP